MMEVLALVVVGLWIRQVAAMMHEAVDDMGKAWGIWRIGRMIVRRVKIVIWWWEGNWGIA